MTLAGWSVRSASMSCSRSHEMLRARRSSAAALIALTLACTSKAEHVAVRDIVVGAPATAAAAPPASVPTVASADARLGYGTYRVTQVQQDTLPYSEGT